VLGTRERVEPWQRESGRGAHEYPDASGVKFPGSRSTGGPMTLTVLLGGKGRSNRWILVTYFPCRLAGQSPSPQEHI
jgi:hypothetical protein